MHGQWGGKYMATVNCSKAFPREISVHSCSCNNMSQGLLEKLGQRGEVKLELGERVKCLRDDYDDGGDDDDNAGEGHRV
jgi:hypothetical protein